MDVLRAPQREMQHARSDRLVAHLVDQDEAAERGVRIVRFEHDPPFGRHFDHADGIEVQAGRRQLRHRVDVDLVFRLGDRGGHGLRAELEPVSATRLQRFGVHPDERRFELVGHLGRIVGGCDDVAARTIDFIVESERDRIARFGAVPVAVEGRDRAHRGSGARGQNAYCIAGLDRAARDLARKAAEVLVGAVDPLDRQAERRVRARLVAYRDGFEMRDQRRAVPPIHRFRFGGDIVSGYGRKRDRRDALDPEFLGKGAVFGLDRVEPFLAEIDKVHLVDRQHHVANAEPVAQETVAARLGQHALARIDQDDGGIGSGRAGDHVARILFVARTIGDDELARLGREEAIGDVDRDALFALRRQPIDQQREIELRPARARCLAVRLQRFQLVREDPAAVIEQAPDQRRFAIVHAAAGDEAQHVLVAMAVEIFANILVDQGIGAVGGVVRPVHQKYPSTFLRSIPAPESSLSIARPWRSLVVVSNISRTTPSSVSASLSTAPVSG